MNSLSSEVHKQMQKKERKRKRKKGQIDPSCRADGSFLQQRQIALRNTSNLLLISYSSDNSWHNSDVLNN